MRQKRYFICLLPALLLAAALCLPARAFSKEPSSWAAEQCKHLEDVGLLGWQLYTGSADPASAINRGAFCQMLVSLVQMEGDWEKIGMVEPVPSDYFADTDADFGFAMYYGASIGITEGTIKNGQRETDARGKLTREQAAKMMCAAIDALETYGGVPAPQEGEGKTYTDQSSISAWAADSVARASRMGVLQGDSSGKFNPQGTLTWQEACVMVDRLYTSAEPAVKARRAEQGIRMIDTSLESYAVKQPNADSTMYYALENGERQFVLYISSDRTQVRLEFCDGTGTKTIPLELETCGGFYEGPENYYLAFGQNNMEESAGKTVYRVVKYDKSWNRLGAADISDCYTTVPFDFTSHTAMAEKDGTLILHTSRQRYLTPDDGLRHQSNFTAKIRVSDMAVLEQSEEFPRNHVSHSFAQYVAFDGEIAVYADHGDAYPRGFSIDLTDSEGLLWSKNFFPFSGAAGDNTTNAVPGGLGISGSKYLFAGASSPQKGNDSLEKANAFLAVIPKDGGDPQIQWLTSFPGDGTAYVNDVCLVEVNNNTFVVLWQVTRPGGWRHSYDSLQYAVFDGQGRQTGEAKSLPGYIIPSADPSVYGNRIVWASPELDASQSSNFRKNRYINIFELDIDANKASADSSSVGPQVGLTVPDAMTLAVGETRELKTKIVGLTGGVSYQSSDPSVVSIWGSLLTGEKDGTAEVTVSMTWRGKTYSDTCQVTVGSGVPSVTPPTTPTAPVTPTTPTTPTTPAAPTTPTTPSTPQPTAPSWPGEAEIRSDGVIRTKLPADGVVTAYQEEFAGTWTRLEVVDGNTLRFSGSSALNGTYNYAVLRVGREAGETPVTAGVPFRVQIPVDVSALSGEGPVHVAAVIAQNYHPGDVDYGGYPFQSGARAMLTASGGKLALRIVNG